METVKELRISTGNGESLAKGVYQLPNGSFQWMTFTRSGECKKLATAMKKAGF